MGISCQTLRNKRKEKLAELDYFCDYSIIYTKTGRFSKIQINKVYIEKYEKLQREQEKILNIIIDKLNRVTGNIEGKDLNSNKGIAKLLKDMYPDDYKIEVETLSRKVSKILKSLFGIANVKNKTFFHPGPLGYRQYQWSIKLDNMNNEYRPLTKEEQTIFNQLCKEFIDRSSEEIQEMALFKSVSKEDNELQKEYNQYIQDNYNFYDVILEFKEKTGYQLAIATKYSPKNNKIERIKQK